MLLRQQKHHRPVVLDSMPTLARLLAQIALLAGIAKTILVATMCSVHQVTIMIRQWMAAHSVKLESSVRLPSEDTDQLESIV